MSEWSEAIEHNNRIAGLDILRGMMCFFIITYHFFSMLDRNHTKPASLVIFYEMAHSLIQVFFIISSFTLAKRYRDFYLDLESSKLRFYLARFSRVQPLWIVFILLSHLALYRHVNWKYVWANLLMYFGFLLPLHADYNFTLIGWSIFVEEIFYLFFPLVFGFMKKPKMAILITLFFSCISFFWVNFYFENGNIYEVGTRGILANLQCLMCGFVCFYFYEKFQNWFKTFKNADNSWFILFFSCFVLVASSFIHYSFRFMMLAPVVLLSTQIKRENVFMIKYFESLGRYCYGAYLFHVLFGVGLLVTIHFNWNEIRPIYTPYNFFLLTLVQAITFIFAYFSYHYFEYPIVKKASSLKI